MKLHPQKIKALMVEHGISQASIARDLGITRQVVCMVVAGTCVSRRVQEAICRRLGRPFEEIWGPKSNAI